MSNRRTTRWPTSSTASETLGEVQRYARASTGVKLSLVFRPPVNRYVPPSALNVRELR